MSAMQLRYVTLRQKQRTVEISNRYFSLSGNRTYDPPSASSELYHYATDADKLGLHAHGITGFQRNNVVPGSEDL